MSRGSPLNIAATYLRLRSDASIKLFLILIACFIHGANGDGHSETATEYNMARQAREIMTSDTGTGAYPAAMLTDPHLPDHVIYRPAELESLRGKKLGIVLWGNGACTNDGASARLHLTEIASHGYLVIAPGRILSGPSVSAATGNTEKSPMSTNDEDMLAGLEWALAENCREGSPYHGKLAPDAIAVSGHSCGGILAVKIATRDPRIKAIVVHNSGVFPNRPERPTLITDKQWLRDLNSPILYIVGNSSDVGQPVALDDYSRIDHVPVFLASLDVGHEGTFAEPHGGSAAAVAIDWLKWQLYGDEAAAQTFVGPDCALCADPAWTVQRKGFD